MSKKSCFRGPFYKEHGKRFERLCKSKRQHLYHIYGSPWKQFRLKFLWVISKILGLFVNPFTASDKYSLLNKDNLKKHFQMQLSQNWKPFSQFFSLFMYFLNLYSNLNIFKNKDDPHSWYIFEDLDSEKRG